MNPEAARIGRRGPQRDHHDPDLPDDEGTLRYSAVAGHPGIQGGDPLQPRAWEISCVNVSSRVT